MKIGVFDSGLGGLLLAQAIRDELPQYDYLYLGDTKRVPYGNRSQEVIYQYTEEAVRHLFAQDCALVILACNTASAEALRRIQQEFLPTHAPEKRVLGVIIPTAEEVGGAQRIGVLATTGTVNSQTFVREIAKLHPKAVVTQSAAPLLVPLIEQHGLKYLDPILTDYLQPLSTCDTIILGCTHYSAIKNRVRSLLPHTNVLSQDEIVPKKIRAYLERHPEISSLLSNGSSAEYTVTDLAPGYTPMVEELVGAHIPLTLTTL